MKWIGQHIWDFISRFRNDVYLEDIDSGTIASGGNLGLDSNNKIVKSASPSGSIDLTSEVTGTLPVANGGTGATSLTNNSILTGTGTSAITAEANLTYNPSIGGLITSGAQAGGGMVQVTETSDNADGALLVFTNTRGGSDAQDNDVVGQINFTGRNDGAPEVQTYGHFITYVADATDGQEAGRIEFKVAEYDGTLTTGLKLDGDTNADGEVDVTISAGAASTTTIAGTLTMGSTAFANNSGLLQVAAQTNITSLGTLTNLQVDDVNINTKSIEILGDTGDTFNITTGAAGATTLTTVDAGGAVGHLSLIADGNIYAKIPDQLEFSIVNTDGSGGTSHKFTSEVSAESHFYMYPSGGGVTADYFHMEVGQDGNTVIRTIDGAGGPSANLQITADGTAELAGTTVTLDSAANVELEVGGVTNYVQTTGIFRGSNIGTIQNGKLPVSPTQFISDSFRYAPQYVIADGGISTGNAAVNYYAEIIIPNGYTATACTMYATDADNDGTIKCYEGSTIANTSSLLASADTFSSGSVTHDFGSNDVVGDGYKTVIIAWDPGDTADRLHGGFISITKTT